MYRLRWSWKTMEYFINGSPLCFPNGFRALSWSAQCWMWPGITSVLLWSTDTNNLTQLASDFPPQRLRSGLSDISLFLCCSHNTLIYLQFPYSFLFFFFLKTSKNMFVRFGECTMFWRWTDLLMNTKMFERSSSSTWFLFIHLFCLPSLKESMQTLHRNTLKLGLQPSTWVLSWSWSVLPADSFLFLFTFSTLLTSTHFYKWNGLLFYLSSCKVKVLLYGWSNHMICHFMLLFIIYDYSY